jgi:hypothetical protein
VLNWQYWKISKSKRLFHGRAGARTMLQFAAEWLAGWVVILALALPLGIFGTVIYAAISALLGRTNEKGRR